MLKVAIGVLAVFTALANAVQLRPYGNDQVTPKPLLGGDMDGCTQQFVTCMAPMITSGSGNFTIGGPETWTAAQLTQRCNMFKTVEECIRETTGSCHEEVVRQSDILVRLMSFVCTDVFDEMIQLSNCTGSSRSQGHLQQCVQNLARAQASLMTADSNQNAHAAQCSILFNYEECVIEVEGDDCGPRAQMLYARIFENTNRIIAKQLNCSAVVNTGDGSGEVAILEPSPEEKCVPVVAECLQQLETHRGAMTDFDLNELPAICNDYKGAKTCMDSRAVECEEAPEWQALEDSFTAMCNPATQRALTGRDVCFTKTSLNTKLENCEKEELQREAEMEEDRTCQVLEDYLNCYNTAVQEECPTEIANAVENVLEGVGGIIQLEKSVDCDEEEKILVEEESIEDEGDQTVHVDTQECALVIAQCLQPLAPHRKSFTSFQLETIPQVCSDYGSVQNCMVESAQECKNTDEWSIIEDAFAQICVPAYQGVPECAVRSDVVTKLQSCEKDELKAEVQIGDSRTCEMIEDYVNCYTITVDRECEEKDGQMVSQVMTGVAQVIQLDKEVMCVTDEDSEEDDGTNWTEDVGPDDVTTESPTEEPVIGDALDEQMSETWGPLAMCVDWMEGSPVTGLPVHQFDTVDELCDQLYEANQCAQPMLDDLPTDVQNSWDALMTVYNYMCNEKRQEFRDVYPCLSRNLASQTLAEKCFERVKDEEGSETDVCKMVEDFEKCSTNVVRDDCGYEAGQLMEGLMDKMNTLLAKQYHVNCPFIGKKALIIGLSVGGVILVILIMICACKLASKRRRSRSAALDKKDLVKHDILANVHLGIAKDSKKDEVATISVTKLEV